MERQLTNVSTTASSSLAASPTTAKAAPLLGLGGARDAAHPGVVHCEPGGLGLVALHVGVVVGHAEVARVAQVRGPPASRSWKKIRLG